MMGYASLSLELIQARANPWAKDLDNRTPWEIAVDNQSDTLQRILNHSHPDPDAQVASVRTGVGEEIDKDQALIQAAISGDELQLKKLLHEGADIRYRDSDGFRAIDRARDNGHNHIADILYNAEYHQ
jgi:ankyrin repeat protein